VLLWSSSPFPVKRGSKPRLACLSSSRYRGPENHLPDARPWLTGLLTERGRYDSVACISSSSSAIESTSSALISRI
jgi:hypothetical protein